jgi:hypothetical protein
MYTHHSCTHPQSEDPDSPLHPQSPLGLRRVPSLFGAHNAYFNHVKYAPPVAAQWQWQPYQLRQLYTGWKEKLWGEQLQLFKVGTVYLDYNCSRWAREVRVVRVVLWMCSHSFHLHSVYTFTVHSLYIQYIHSLYIQCIQSQLYSVVIRILRGIRVGG